MVLASETVSAPASDQQADWYHREAQHRNPDLVLFPRFNLATDTEPVVFEQAVQRLVRRHEALRTSFAEHYGSVVQVIRTDPPEGVTWVEDLRSLAPVDRAATLDMLRNRERRHVFDLHSGPLVRAGLIRCSDTQAVVSLTLHHIIADGGAVEILRRELSALLASIAAGTELELPPAMQCREWSEAELTWAQGREAGEQLAYWREALADLQPLSVPPPDGAATTADDRFVHAELSLPLPDGLQERLKVAARARRSTPSAVALTAHLKLLSLLTGRSDVATMTMTIGRTRPGYDTVVGSLTNVITIRAQHVTDTSMADLLLPVRNTLFAAYTNYRLFVTRIWAATHLNAGDIDTLFIYDDFDLSAPDAGAHSLTWATGEPPRAFERRGPWWENFKLRHTASSEVPSIAIEFNARLYPQDFIERAAVQYFDLLAEGTS